MMGTRGAMSLLGGVDSWFFVERPRVLNGVSKEGGAYLPWSRDRIKGVQGLSAVPEFPQVLNEVERSR
jgi:hypothetical protein